jgi:hypothetical protein
MDLIVEFNEAAFRHGISKEDILHALKTRMTEEEALALDDFVTNNEITLGPNGSDWLSQREMRLLGMSTITVNYLLTKALADHKSPAQLIDELVQEKIAVSM